jgi:hypothetical protein
MRISIRKVIAVLLITVFIPIALCAYLFWMYANKPSCEEQFIENRLSPNKQYVAATYLMSCGATTGYTTHVFVYKKSIPIKPDHDGLYPTLRQICWVNGKKNLKLHWKSDTHFEVSVNDEDAIIHCLSKIDNITITKAK